MSIDGKCLDFWNVCGDYDKKRIAHMEYLLDKCIINLEPFFDEHFEERDKLMKKDVEQRKEKLENKIRYNFTMIEFLEAFIGSFPQNELADFFEKHIDKEQPQSEYFVRQIKNFDENYRWCFPCWWDSNVRLYSVDFSVKKLNRALEKVPKSIIYKGVHRNFQPKMKGFREDLRETKFYGSTTLKTGWPKNYGMNCARDVLIETRKPIIISKTKALPVIF